MGAVNERDRWLTIDSCVNGSEITVNVADTGSGIEAAKIGKVFEPFFTTKSEGMGLGLFICRSIVEAHSGKLSISPNIPLGTVFHLALPAAETDENG